ncbi:hypothetical protein GF373_01810 [bacterium]|nr:hypothetical protein [bacterium]
MPVYVYEHDVPQSKLSKNCRLRFEIMQKISEEPLNECPTCGKPCHRVIAGFAAPKISKDDLNLKHI